MSKSKGTFITAKHAASCLPPEAVRYYLAAHLDGSISDLDLDTDRFVDLINSDIVGRLVNIASRCTKLLQAHQEGKLSTHRDASLLAPIRDEAPALAKAYESRNTALALRKIAALADQINARLSEEEPWKKAKDESQKESAMILCSTAMEGFLILMGYLAPVMPRLAEQSFALFSDNKPSWLPPSPQGTLRSFSPLFVRIKKEEAQALFETKT